MKFQRVMVLGRDREEEQEESSKPCYILSFEFTCEIPDSSDL